MPTLSGDTQAVLATDKVRFQGQEVAFVIAEDRYSARDALELVEVEYEPRGGSPPAIVNAVCDALMPFGVLHVDMPCTPGRVWDAMQGKV
jgi:CO/xanthine dehydrogenase Mo-binding subunit